MSALSDLMGVLLPGGVAAGSVLVLQAVKSWREGRSSREETVLQRWQRVAREETASREIAEQDEAYAIVVADHWRQRSADLEFLMREAGIRVPPRPPVPVRGRKPIREQTRTPIKKVRPTARSDQDELE